MKGKRLCLRLFFFSLFFSPFFIYAQVNSVEFGKNRVQYKKFAWKFYQSPNFNVYFSTGGNEIAKYIAQVAEEELNSVEKEVEYSLQRRADIVIYNNYEDYKSSNIGLDIDWQNAGGLTRLVNNKIPVFFDGNHNDLHTKVREGIARTLTNNLLFGEDIGEFASNQALLDLPTWLTDGYVEWVAEKWTIAKDDSLKNAMLSGEYRNFYQFAFDKPLLAGQSFWYYIAKKYKPQNVTYFLYLARLYKNLNTASQKICKKKFKDVLEDFMNEELDYYVKDIKQRRNAPRGKLSIVEETYKSDFFHFAANPNPKNNSYAVVKFTKGKYSVKYFDNFYEEKTLLDYGVRTIVGDINPNYPILAWDGKGSRLLCIYSKESKTRMFVYDAISGLKRFNQEIEGFDQILDAGFIFDANTLLFSAVKNGHSDLYTYRIDNGRIKQITNDVYDDLDPTFVSFPNRLGVLFASNRPGINAPNSDTVQPSRNRFNIYLADINNNSEFRQITQLTNMKYGDARYPMQYNLNHFTFISDENGIANRWAGFFSSQTGGIDTLYYIGEDILHNPLPQEMDSTLNAWQKDQPDSISYFKVYDDSTYTFPITNYQSSVLETRVAGNNSQVSEVRQEGDYKFLYKLRIDTATLRKRNVNARPTEYVRSIISAEKMAAGAEVEEQQAEPEQQKQDQFQNEFEDSTSKPEPATNTTDTSAVQTTAPPPPPAPNPLEKLQLYDYRLKFEADYVLAGVSNNILINRFQPFGGYNQQGPIQLNNGNDVNFTFRVGVSDIMEDIKLIGGIRFGTSIEDKDAFLTFMNYRRRIDWGFTYYRSNYNNQYGIFDQSDARFGFDNEVFTNLYQLNFAYPFDEVRSFRANLGMRLDRVAIKPYFFGVPVPDGLPFKDSTAATPLAHIEYVYDNTVKAADNIPKGLRWKVYADAFLPSSTGSSIQGKAIYNVGFDARNYVQIYRNFIWAVRAAGDFSFGEAKIIYYLGGADGWISPKFNPVNTADTRELYAFQSLAINLRGFQQNVSNGSKAMVVNSEFRLPVFTTFFSKPINNAFLRNFQLIQFFDLGTAWSGGFNNIQRPSVIFGPEDNNPVTVRQRAGGIGPFAGGYGFGARSTLLGYFLKLDAGWPMSGLFKGKPMWYFALGFDF